PGEHLRAGFDLRYRGRRRESRAREDDADGPGMPGRRDASGRSRAEDREYPRGEKRNRRAGVGSAVDKGPHERGRAAGSGIALKQPKREKRKTAAIARGGFCVCETVTAI